MRSVAKTKTILQMEIVECGAASLAMVCAYYGKHIPLERMRQECGVGRDGVKASSIVKAAANLGFKAKGFKKEPKDLASMRFPAIIHWNFNHFVVLEGFKHGRAYLNDPAVGRRAVTAEEFDAAFTGVVLTFEPDESFERGGAEGGMLDSLRKRARLVASAIVLLVAVGVLMIVPGLVTPLFSRIFIDDILIAGGAERLVPLIAALLATAAVQGGLAVLNEHVLLRVNQKLSVIGAAEYVWHLLRLPVMFFQQRSAGDLHIRLGDNDEAADFIAGEFASNAIRALMMLFFFAVMLHYNVTLTLVSLALAGLSVAVMTFASGKTLNDGLAQDAGKLYGATVSGLSLIETLKATGLETGYFSRWAGFHAKLANAKQRIGAVNAALSALPILTIGLSDAAVMFVGGLEIIDGRMTVGTLIAFQGLLAAFFAPVNALAGMGTRIAEIKSRMARVDDVEKYPPDAYTDFTRTAAEDEQTAKLTGGVELRGVTFGYNTLEPPLIEDFSLKLTAGRSVALVGGSGSGKSTVLKLITGLHHPWRGEILFDGVNRDELPIRAITKSLAVVDQDISLFAGTIRGNISMWDETLTDAAVIKAAKDAQIHADIELREGGFDSAVSEAGANMSGGQRQRLEIARALAAEPSILVMDEATSALDPHTEQIITENIKRRGCTTITVAHRLSTIRDCDEIIVMNGGRIAERGTHEELSARGGIYAELTAYA